MRGSGAAKASNDYISNVSHTSAYKDGKQQLRRRLFFTTSYQIVIKTNDDI